MIACIVKIKLAQKEKMEPDADIKRLYSILIFSYTCLMEVYDSIVRHILKNEH